MTRQRATRSGGLTFHEWSVLVNHWLAAIGGERASEVSVDGLAARFDFWDAYENDWLPVRAAREALAVAGLE